MSAISIVLSLATLSIFLLPTIQKFLERPAKYTDQEFSDELDSILRQIKSGSPFIEFRNRDLCDPAFILNLLKYPETYASKRMAELTIYDLEKSVDVNVRLEQLVESCNVPIIGSFTQSTLDGAYMLNMPTKEEFKSQQEYIARKIGLTS